jgi:hypothetical protein
MAAEKKRLRGKSEIEQELFNGMTSWCSFTTFEPLVWKRCVGVRFETLEPVLADRLRDIPFETLVESFGSTLAQPRHQTNYVNRKGLPVRDHRPP